MVREHAFSSRRRRRPTTGATTSRSSALRCWLLELSSEGTGFIHVEGALRLFKRYRNQAMKHFAKAIAFNRPIQPPPWARRGARVLPAIGEISLVMACD